MARGHVLEELYFSASLAARCDHMTNFVLMESEYIWCMQLIVCAYTTGYDYISWSSSTIIAYLPHKIYEH